MDYALTIGETEKCVTLEKKDGGYRVAVGDREYIARDVSLSDGVLTFFIGHHSYRAVVSRNSLGTQITISGRDYFLESEDEGDGASKAVHHPGDGSVEAPMPGSVVAVNVKVGDSVKAGDSLVVLESMKMQNEISAPVAGKVKAVHCAKGEQVAFGATLVEIAPGS